MSVEKIKCVHCGRPGAHAPKCVLTSLDRLARDPDSSAWLVALAVRESFDLRPFDKLVDTFGHWMKRKIRANAHKGGWEDADPGVLVGKLRGEVDELVDAIRKMRTTTGMGPDVIDEAVDVAIYCLMIADQVFSRRWR